MTKKSNKKQMPLKKVRFGPDGVPSHYLIQGNKRATPVKTIAKMADNGCIKDVHSYDIDHVRSDPDKNLSNNLRNLPKF